MGTQKTETTQSTETKMRGRSGQEQQMLDLFAKLAGGSAGGIDMNALRELATGQGLMPSAGDRALVEESFSATNDMAQRALEEFVRKGNLNLDEVLSSRGLQGSSIESVQRGLVTQDAGRQLAQMLDNARGQSAQALMGLPFQRAGMQLNANQQLFNQLLGAGGAAANFGLQERIADIDTFGQGTQEYTPGALDYFQAAASAGGQAAGAYFGGA